MWLKASGRMSQDNIPQLWLGLRGLCTLTGLEEAMRNIRPVCEAYRFRHSFIVLILNYALRRFLSRLRRNVIHIDLCVHHSASCQCDWSVSRSLQNLLYALSACNQRSFSLSVCGLIESNCFYVLKWLHVSGWVLWGGPREPCLFFDITVGCRRCSL